MHLPHSLVSLWELKILVLFQKVSFGCCYKVECMQHKFIFKITIVYARIYSAVEFKIIVKSVRIFHIFVNNLYTEKIMLTTSLWYLVIRRARRYLN